MKRLFTSFFLLTTALVFAQQTNQSITIGGVNRTYVQYLPTGFQASENMPAVIVLHGIGADGANMVGTGFNQIADTARFVAIYPDGLPNNFGQNSWNNGTLLASTANDIGFIGKIMDDLILNKNVDPTRIYVTGFSMGGIMSHHLACVMNDRIAAIGSMSGTMSTSDIANCTPSYKTPVIHLHGDADGTVPYSGTALPSLSLVYQTMDFWKSVHGCTATYDSIRLPDNAPADNITIDRFVYNNCSTTDDLELWRFNGADHQFLYEPLNDITESFEVWRFFIDKQHSNPAAAGIEDNSESMIRIFPNPTTGILNITLDGNLDSYQVLDLSGRVITSTSSNMLDLSQFENGQYLIKVGNAVRMILKQD